MNSLKDLQFKDAAGELHLPKVVTFLLQDPGFVHTTSVFSSRFVSPYIHVKVAQNEKHLQDQLHIVAYSENLGLVSRILKKIDSDLIQGGAKSQLQMVQGGGVNALISGFQNIVQNKSCKEKVQIMNQFIQVLDHLITSNLDLDQIQMERLCECLEPCLFHEDYGVLFYSNGLLRNLFSKPPFSNKWIEINGFSSLLKLLNPSSQQFMPDLTCCILELIREAISQASTETLLPCIKENGMPVWIQLLNSKSEDIVNTVLLLIVTLLKRGKEKAQRELLLHDGVLALLQLINKWNSADILLNSIIILKNISNHPRFLMDHHRWSLVYSFQRKLSQLAVREVVPPDSGQLEIIDPEMDSHYDPDLVQVLNNLTKIVMAQLKEKKRYDLKIIDSLCEVLPIDRMNISVDIHNEHIHLTGKVDTKPLAITSEETTTIPKSLERSQVQFSTQSLRAEGSQKRPSNDKVTRQKPEKKPDEIKQKNDSVAAALILMLEPLKKEPKYLISQEKLQGLSDLMGFLRNKDNSNGSNFEEIIRCLSEYCNIDNEMGILSCKVLWKLSSEEIGQICLMQTTNVWLAILIKNLDLDANQLPLVYYTCLILKELILTKKWTSFLLRANVIEKMKRWMYSEDEYIQASVLDILESILGCQNSLPREEALFSSMQRKKSAPFSIWEQLNLKWKTLDEVKKTESIQRGLRFTKVPPNKKNKKHTKIRQNTKKA